MTAAVQELWRLREFASLLSGYARVQLLRAGLELGLFDALREPSREVRLAERLGLDRELVSAWLRAAHAHGLLRRGHHPSDAYRIGPLARWLLDSPQSGSLRALLDQHVETYAPIWQRLPRFARGAQRAHFGAAAEVRRAAEVSRLLEGRALAALGRIPGAVRARRVLDVGCGYGSYLTGLLVRYRDAHGVGIELDPAVAEEARRRLSEAGVSRRAEVREGDFLTLELPRGTFDLVLFNDNLYYFPPHQHRALFERARRRLAPGGVLAIHVPVATAELAARVAGATRALTAFDLFLRCHRNLYGLPEAEPLRALLQEVGYAETGEVPFLPGGAARYVWARAPASG